MQCGTLLNAHTPNDKQIVPGAWPLWQNRNDSGDDDDDKIEKCVRFTWFCTELYIIVIFINVAGVGYTMHVCGTGRRLE